MGIPERTERAQSIIQILSIAWFLSLDTSSLFTAGLNETTLPILQLKRQVIEYLDIESISSKKSLLRKLERIG